GRCRSRGKVGPPEQGRDAPAGTWTVSPSPSRICSSLLTSGNKSVRRESAYLERSAAQRAAACAGGGAVRCVRASFFVRHGIAAERARCSGDPPFPRTRVGEKGRLLPHEAPFSVFGPGSGRQPEVAFYHISNLDREPLLAWLCAWR